MSRTKKNEFNCLGYEVSKMQQLGYKPQVVKIRPGKDYGCDPLGDGMFRMIPSGRIVSAQQKVEILKEA